MEEPAWPTLIRSSSFYDFNEDDSFRGEVTSTWWTGPSRGTQEGLQRFITCFSSIIDLAAWPWLKLWYYDAPLTLLLLQISHGMTSLIWILIQYSSISTSKKNGIESHRLKALWEQSVEGLTWRHQFPTCIYRLQVNRFEYWTYLQTRSSWTLKNSPCERRILWKTSVCMFLKGSQARSQELQDRNKTLRCAFPGV